MVVRQRLVVASHQAWGAMPKVASRRSQRSWPRAARSNRS